MQTTIARIALVLIVFIWIYFVDMIIPYIIHLPLAVFLFIITSPILALAIIVDHKNASHDKY